MKKMIVILFAAIASVTSATLINFTPVEGYTNNADLTDHPDWAGNYGGFKVGVSSNLVPNADFKKNIFSESVSPLVAGKTMEVSAVFRFTEKTARGSNKYLIGVEAFTNAALTGSAQFQAYFRRSGTDNYVVGLDIDGQQFVTDDNLGLTLPDNSDLVSDTLKLTLRLESGAVEDTVTAIIENLDTGYSATYSSTTAKLDQYYFGLYSALSSSETDSTSVESFEVIPEVIIPLNVEFSAEQGYEPGKLFGQETLWTGHDDTLIAVDSSTNYVAISTANTWQQSIYTESPGSNTVTEVGGGFRFQRTAGAAAGFYTTLGFELRDEAALSGSLLRAALIRTTSSNTPFRIGFADQSGSSVFENSDAFSESELGFGAGDDQSDDLKLSLKATRGATSNDWTCVLTLSNLTAGTQVSQLTVTNVETTAAFYESDLYGAFTTGNLETDSMVSNRQLESFYISSSNPALSPYQSWIASYGLVGSDADSGADPDGDNLTNIEEYGLGGNPNDSGDIGNTPVHSIVADAGTNWFQFVHVERSAPDAGVLYAVEVTQDLVSGNWTNAGIISAGSGPFDADFDAVTNRVSTEGKSKEFLRLTISPE